MAKSRAGAALVLAAVMCLLVAACGSGGGGGDSGGGARPPAPPGHDVGTRLNAPVPSRILHLPLTDQNGKRTDLAAYRGKVVVLSDAMTLCQETCPMDTADLIRTARAVAAHHQAGKVEFLSVTVDPRRDTPAQLAAYRRLFAPPPADWQLLTGSPATIAALWKHFGVWTRKVPQDSPAPKNWRTGRTLTYDIEHSDEIFFLDPRGHERFVLEGVPQVKPGTLPSTLHRFLSDEGIQHLEHPDASAWTVPQALHVLSWLLRRDLGGGR